MIRRLAIVITALAGCVPEFDHGWQIQDPDNVLTPDFEREILTASEIIRSQERVLHRRWGGTITVHPAPFACPVTVCDPVRGCTSLCAGYTFDNGHTIDVVYDPAVGLGPATGTTAIEWELCQAARMIVTCGSVSPFNGACGGGDADPEVKRCTEEAISKVKEAMP